MKSKMESLSPAKSGIMKNPNQPIQYPMRPATASPKKSRKAEVQNLCNLVNKQDRLTAAQVVGYLQQLLLVQREVQDPQDDIMKIFDKILTWKKSYGDLDKQEKMVAHVLKNSGANAVNIHNVRTLTTKLLEFSDEIGLTTNELTLIIFTSLDLDYLTNLLVMAGEFLNWFNLNFEGESTEETDFKQNKEEIWVATCTYAQRIIQEFQMMEKPKEQAIILNPKWWEITRFLTIGSAMK
jgi:hypothetical protein